MASSDRVWASRPELASLQRSRPFYPGRKDRPGSIGGGPKSLGRSVWRAGGSEVESLKTGNGRSGASGNAMGVNMHSHHFLRHTLRALTLSRS